MTGPITTTRPVILTNPTPPDPSYQIACLIWHELTGRKGIGNELESYDTAIQRRIFYGLMDCAHNVLSRLEMGYIPADPPAFLFDADDQFTSWPSKEDR